MLYLTITLALAVFGSSSAQVHGGGHGGLHGICHSNHQQLTEDQVIQNVVSAMNTDPDGTVETDEMLVFFADLMGLQLGMAGDLLANMTNEELLQVASGLRIDKQAFVHAWHARFHDNMEFIGATFDAFDVNKDGSLDAMEIEGIVTTALATGDANGDGSLEESELIVFLERIYKNC